MLPVISTQQLTPPSDAQLRLVTRVVTALVGVSAVIIAASFPLAYFYAAQSRLNGEIAVEARLFAGEAATAAEQNPDFWNALAGSADAVNLEGLESARHRQSQGQLLITRRIFRNVDGRALSSPSPDIRLAWPAISARSDFLRGLGAVEISSSLQPTLWNTAALSIASIAFAILFHYALRMLPMRLLIKEMRRANYLAQHDPLTGLFNRAVLAQHLDKALAQGHEVVLLLIDLDDFKTINDSSGHDKGDKTLQTVARRLEKAAAVADVVARLGGDEFAVLLDGAPPDHVIVCLCEDIVSALRQPGMDTPGLRAGVSASIGIARSGDEARTALEVLKNADIALYQAKAEGRNLHRFYNPVLHEQVRLRAVFEDDLREALSRNEFFLLYQPQVSLKTRQVEGAEALLRWHRPGHGPVSPQQFIPCAESLGCIKEIGAWVMAQACRDAASWPRPIEVAVNVSALQFRDPQFLDVVRNAIAGSGLDPRRLVLEVTESLLLSDTEHALATIAELHAIGVSVALDDFGTGYSSLSYLTRFRFDSIKIDRSFVHRATEEGRIIAVLRAIFELANSLELSVTAEGIEMETQARLITALGCKKAQGYLFGKPETEQRLIERLTMKPALVARM